MFFLVTPIAPLCDFAACFERARLTQQMKYETLATLCGVTPARLRQCLAGGDFSFRKLWLLTQHEDGRRFVESLLQEISIARGLREWDGVIAALLKATSAIVDGAQMARAGLRREQTDTRRSA
jgi:hypothetical protein